jgi:hypothetical protein
MKITTPGLANTLAVARKLVAYLMAVDREERAFDTQVRVAGNAA